MRGTCLEDLSNEILYEIFEYVAYDHLFQAFSGLNHRFQALLNYFHLPLQIDIPAGSECDVGKFCTQFVTPNKHRIVSLGLHERLCLNSLSSSLTIDASFHRLQSLVCHQISPYQLVSLLRASTLLPRLSSIAAHFCIDLLDLTDVYSSIFRLPHLKKCELSLKGHSLTTSLPVRCSEQSSPIRRMSTNHACKLEELLVFLSYTPLLTHLTCTELSEHDQPLPERLSLTSINLTSLTIGLCNLSFNQLEGLLRNVCKQLQFLSITTSSDVSYLDAGRWEGLISEHLPRLRVFKFAYDEYYYQGIELSSYHSLLNRFTSSFWIDRGWLFQLTVDTDYWPPIKVTYSLYPGRNRSCVISHASSDIDLTVDCLHFATTRESLVDKLFSFLRTLPIIHLTVDCQKLSYRKFVQLLGSLSNLKFLTMTSLSYFNVKDAERARLWLEDNRIVSLEVRSFIEDNDLEKLQFFINLCPRLESLQVKCNYNFNTPSVLRYVLSKTAHQVTSLCLWVPVTSDHLLQQLQTIIDQEKLLTNAYAITRTSVAVHLRWKLQ